MQGVCVRCPGFPLLPLPQNPLVPVCRSYVCRRGGPPRLCQSFPVHLQGPPYCSRSSSAKRHCNSSVAIFPRRWKSPNRKSRFAGAIRERPCRGLLRNGAHRRELFFRAIVWLQVRHEVRERRALTAESLRPGCGAAVLRLRLLHAHEVGWRPRYAPLPPRRRQPQAMNLVLCNVSDVAAFRLHGRTRPQTSTPPFTGTPPSKKPRALE